jgi:transmembrane sensor
MKPGREDELRLAERAAEWVGVLKDANDQRTGFFDWLAQSPRHVAEVLAMLVQTQEIAELTPEQLARIEQLAGDEDSSDTALANVVSLARQSEDPAASEDRPRSRSGERAGPRLRWTLVAAAASVLVLAGSWWIARVTGTQTYRTAIGEQRVLALPDGSIVHLNTRSRLEVDFTDGVRSVQLLDGQALFKVQHDAARPFLVHTGSAVIRAIGTQFDVYRRQLSTHVSVLEGVVQISPETSVAPLAVSASSGTSATRATDRARSPRAPTQLAAGQGADIAAGGAITRREPLDVVQTTAWRQRRLVFREDTLGDIAAEFNRYNPAPQVRVIGSAATDQHFSGTFDANSPETLMQALAGDETLIVERTAHEIVIRPRESSMPPIATDDRH